MLCILGSAHLYGQGQDQKQVLVPPVLPPSPDAASLGKYGNVPVGLNTGIPNIDIPLYTIKAGKLEVPISISYHAAGIKVSDISSWVGIGWTLNAGGVISRSVVGGPDDVGGFWSSTLKNAQQIDMINDHNYLRSLANSSVDGESDYYFYNFVGRSGKFIYEQNTNQNPYLIPKEPLSIAFVGGHYEVTDEFGTKYVFAANEITESFNVNQQSMVSYNSSYFLTEIISADGNDHINFTYSTDLNGLAQGFPVYTEAIGQQCSGNPVPINGYYNATNYNSGQTTYAIHLTGISYPTGRVEFISVNDRADRPNYRLGEVKVYSKDGANVESLVKSFVFNTSYFVSPGTTLTKDHYRLKLNSLTAKEGTGTNVNSYNFSYNETVQMPNRASLAQDWWGYFNGQTNNQSLIKGQVINYLGNNYNVGGYPSSPTVRTPNASTMQAYMLTKIVYPTGGYTEFDFEPHQYYGTTSTNESRLATAAVFGNTTNLHQQTIVFTPATSGPARISAILSDVTDAIPYYSTVKLRRQSDSYSLLDYLYDYTVTPHPSELVKDFYVSLTAGTTYELIVMAKGNSTSTYYGNAAFSTATIYWEEVTTGAALISGGLRVKEIRDFLKEGATPIKKIYKYGIDEQGFGELLIPEDALSTAIQEVDFEYNINNQGLCGRWCSGSRLVLSGKPALELTSLNGAPVVYSDVTVYDQDATTKPNGKQSFKFAVEKDHFYFTDKAYNNGRLQMNESWRGGHETWNGISSSAGDLLRESTTSYSIYNTPQAIGTKVGWRVILEGCGFPSTAGNTYSDNNFYFYIHDYPYVSGVKKVSSTVEKQYSAGSSHSTSVDYFYDNLNSNHQQLSRKITLNSDGQELKSKFWYPADYSTSTENINNLLTNHVIGIPIKEETYRNDQIIGGKVSKIDDYGNPKEIYQYESTLLQAAPAHNPLTMVPSNYVKRAELIYDETTHNIKSVQYSDNLKTAYLWGYNNSVPIAEVKNIDFGPLTEYNNSNVIGIDITGPAMSVTALSPSFEVGTFQTVNPTLTVMGLGTNLPPDPYLTVYLVRANDLQYAKVHNCTWGSNSVSSISVSPGLYYWAYTTNITTGNGFNGERLDITTNYTAKLSGYKFNYTSFEDTGIADANSLSGNRVWSGTYTLRLPGYQGTYKVSYWKKLNGNNPWTLIESTQTVGAGSYEPSMVIGTTGYSIDEVRVVPVDASMTTYSYDPAIGITSTTDPNNLTMYYKYDSFGRLKWLKDYKGNIVKAFDYHYKGN